MASAIRIMDTSIYLTVLGVPKHERGDSGRVEQLRNEVERCAKNDVIIIIPLGTIVETGNHIASAVDGRRYGIVNRFIEDITAAIEDRAPYSIGMVNSAALREWLDLFRSHSSSNLELGDVTCIAEFNRCREIYPVKPVMIWSDDEELISYNYIPNSTNG